MTVPYSITTLFNFAYPLLHSNCVRNSCLPITNSLMSLTVTSLLLSKARCLALSSLVLTLVLQ